MSLNWELTQIKDWKEVCWEPKDENGQTQLRAVTHNLIWTTMSVGIGKITEDNWTEFYARTVIHCRIAKLDEFTPEDIKAHIGLKTNVFPDDTRLQFIKRVVNRHIDDHKYAAATKEKHDTVA